MLTAERLAHALDAAVLPALCDHAPASLNVLASRYPMRDITDREEAAVARAVRLAFARAIRALPDTKKALAVAETALHALLTPRLQRVFVQGGTRAAQELSRQLRLRDNATLRDAKTPKATAPTPIVSFRFDADLPEAAAWAKEYAGELIQGLSDTSRARVAEIIASFDDPDEVVRRLEEIFSPERALTIARTETLRAVHEGQRMAWQQAEIAGLLTGNESRVWIVTADDRLCTICAPLDGKTAALDDGYDAGSGWIAGPPAHPNCRCTEGLLPASMTRHASGGGAVDSHAS